MRLLILIFLVTTALISTHVFARGSGDFNSDGFDDLAVTVLGENVNSGADAGLVQIIYGTANGLRSTNNQRWSQDTTGIADSCESADRLSAGVCGDFDGDGFDDLVLAVPFESAGALANVGALHVLYGSGVGLTANSSQLWWQDTNGVADAAEAGDLFAGALAAGDFNNDGFDDLAIGARGENLGTIVDAGIVHVLYGSASGLRTLGSQLWSQNSSGVADAAQANDLFGAALVAGDFDGDGIEDLAIGAPGQNIGGFAGAGAVHVLYGTSIGLKSTDSQYWHQNVTGIANVAAAAESFGGILAAGDLNNDGRDDLVVSVVGQSVSGQGEAGAVHVLFGSVSGLTAIGSQFLTRNSANVLGFAKAGDEFGAAIEVGDFDGDGFDDLAVGAPGADIGTISNAGALHVFYGSGSGLAVAGNQLWSQNSPGILDLCESNDNFGNSLRIGDFNGDGKVDLGIGIPFEDLAGFGNVSATAVMYGTAGGLDDVGDQFWHQDSPGILDAIEASDAVGF